MWYFYSILIVQIQAQAKNQVAYSLIARCAAHKATVPDCAMWGIYEDSITPFALL